MDLLKFSLQEVLAWSVILAGVAFGAGGTVALVAVIRSVIGDLRLTIGILRTRIEALEKQCSMQEGQISVLVSQSRMNS